MTALRSDLPSLPQRMRGLPVDARGYPVPWFVGTVNGEWDFRVIKPGAIEMAIRRQTCWLCGGKLGAYKVFVIGPMCLVNRINSEPPSHMECAQFAAKACPFLTRPMAKRNIHDLPETKEIPGVHLDRNPGAVVLYVCKDYRLIRVDNGMMIELGPAEGVHWFANGREAKRAEATEALDSGLVHLEAMAKEEGPTSVKMLKLRVQEARALLPI